MAGQYLLSLTELAKAALRADRPAEAVAYLTQALAPGYPHSLGEGKLYGAQENELLYWLGCAHEALGESAQARQAWHRATTGSREPTAAMFYNDQQPDQIFYQGRAWAELGQPAEAQAIFTMLLHYGQQHLHDEVKLDYFAVSLPNLLIFDDDLDRRNTLHCRYLMRLSQLEEAEAAFTEVLQQDARHVGAHVHQQLARHPLCRPVRN